MGLDFAYRVFALVFLSMTLAVGCAEEGGPNGPFLLGGSGGTGGVGGTGGGAGTGGVTGGGGMGGDAGMGGAAGTAGSGGSGTGGHTGGGGESGMGGSQECLTSTLCQACPDPFWDCDDDDDCFVGYACIDSGCDELGGAPIGQCRETPGGACMNDGDCPTDYTCLNVPGRGLRCVKSTSGCSTNFDCMMGFSCEGGTCVDRRAACFLDDDCPVGHSCEQEGTSRFCVRVHEDCDIDEDCAGIAPYCVDIDGDGKTECAGELLGGSLACVNADCASPSAPVCEVSLVGSIADCGTRGLCIDDDDCASGFDCVGLWPDGRKECVRPGGTCDELTDCPERTICGSPRTDEDAAPSCMAGVD